MSSVSPGAAAATAIVRELRARAVRVPMPEPHRTASGVIAESPLVLDDVVTDDGVTGHGIVFTYSAAALAADRRARPQHRRRSSSASRWRRPRSRHKLARALPPARHAGAGRHGHLGDRHGALGRAGARRTTCRWCACSAASSEPVRAYGAVGYDGAAGARQGGRGVGEARLHRREGEDRLPRRAARTSRSSARSATPSAPASRSWSTTTSA